MTPESVLANVCATYSVPLRTLLGRRRDAWLSKARRDATRRLYALGMPPDDNLQISLSPMEDIPDDWVVMLRGNRPCVGKETGFLYFTRKGYQANLDRIKAAFMSSPLALGVGQSEVRWRKFQRDAELHFKAVEKSTKRFIEELQGKIAQAEAVQKRL